MMLGEKPHHILNENNMESSFLRRSSRIQGDNRFSGINQQPFRKNTRGRGRGSNQYQTERPRRGWGEFERNSQGFTPSSGHEVRDKTIFSVKHYESNPELDYSILKESLIEEFAKQLGLFDDFEKNLLKTVSNMESLDLNSTEVAPENGKKNKKKPEKGSKIKTEETEEKETLDNAPLEMPDIETRRQLIVLKSELDLEKLKSLEAVKKVRKEHAEKMKTARKKFEDKIADLEQYLEKTFVENHSQKDEILDLKKSLEESQTLTSKLVEKFDVCLAEKQAQMEEEFEEKLQAFNVLRKKEKKKYEMTEKDIREKVSDELLQKEAKLVDKVNSLEKNLKKCTVDLKQAADDNVLLKKKIDALVQTQIKEKLNTLEEFKQILKDNCECGICLGIYSEAVVTACGHSFCRNCMSNWEHRNLLTTCPICRNTTTYKRSHIFDSFISQLTRAFPEIEWTKN